MKEQLEILVTDFINKKEHNFKFNWYSIYFNNIDDRYILKIYKEWDLVWDIFTLKSKDNILNVLKTIYNIIK